MGESTPAGVDGEPPELIIVYYSAGAVVNIHTSGHLPFAHMRASPQLMESVEEAAHFCQKLRICHTFELPSGNWMQRCSAQTSR